ncbi:AGAP010880-PA [Anopheles gambiae str. PEST]|uniref:AGAP010880-PA n=2 Tax=Anopheles gambiae TaxID=7165 RepID=A0NC10_ANOGA|nr:AGAP010880-PA [Anopheles gambiae str. PEST]
MKPSFKNGKFATSIYEKCLCQKNGISRHRRSVLISTCAHKASFRRISKYSPTRTITGSGSTACTIPPSRSSDAGRLSMLPCWPSSRTVAPCSRSSPHRSLPLLQSRPRPHRRRRPSPKVRACCSMTLASQRNRLQERRRRPTAPAMNAATHCSGLPHWPSIRTTTWPSHTLRWSPSLRPSWTRTTTRTC